MNRLRDQFSAEASADRPDHRVRLHRSYHQVEACKKFEGRIRTAQLKDKDNLHLRQPRATAGTHRQSRARVLGRGDAARRSGYFYFVSKNDGTHVFSKTRDEHEVAVDKYQRKPAPSSSGRGRGGRSSGPSSEKTKKPLVAGVIRACYG